MESKQTPRILKQFLKYLSSTKNYCFSTIDVYSKNLMLFFYFIKEYHKIDIAIKSFNYFILANIKESDILAFLIYCNYTKNNSANTRKLKLYAIKSFYKWLFFIYPGGNMKSNPAQNIGNIGKVQYIPKYLSLEEAKKIQNVFTMQNCKNPCRNNAIISLFLSTGIRIGELVAININDISFQNNSIVIRHGKGNKERMAYFSNSCKEKLLKYIQKRNTSINSTEPLFISERKKRIHTHSVECICKQAYQLIGLESYGYTAHTLRHTAATLLYRYAKQDILLVKEFLGHSTVLSTQIYTHTYDEDVKRAVDKNPLNFIDRNIS